MIDLADLGRLAERHLDDGDGRYRFFGLRDDEIAGDAPASFDFRIRQERFHGAHLTVGLVDMEHRTRVGNASILVVHSADFGELLFWRREASQVYRKTSLRELANGNGQVVTLGFVRSASFVLKTHSAYIHRYVRFVLAVARLCEERRVPMLVEPTGQVSLGTRIANVSLTAGDLTPEERAAIGRTRRASAAAEKMARLAGLEESDSLFNERTLGKVFFSVPRLSS